MYHSPYSGGRKQHLSARDNYMSAREDAKIFGRERRLALKKEAERMRLEREVKKGMGGQKKRMQGEDHPR